MLVDVRVCKLDVEHGSIGDCQNCPVALAVNRLLRRGVFAEVVGDYVDLVRFLEPDGGAVHELFIGVRTTRKLEDFVRSFDLCQVDLHSYRGRTFKLDIPKKYLNAATIRRFADRQPARKKTA